MLFIAIFILKIQRSIYDVASKGMAASSEVGPFVKTFGPFFKFSNKINFQF